MCSKKCPDYVWLLLFYDISTLLLIFHFLCISVTWKNIAIVKFYLFDASRFVSFYCGLILYSNFVAIYFVLTVLMSSFEVNVLVFQSDEHYSEFGCSLLIAILASIDFVDSWPLTYTALFCFFASWLPFLFVVICIFSAADTFELLVCICIFCFVFSICKWQFKLQFDFVYILSNFSFCIWIIFCVSRYVICACNLRLPLGTTKKKIFKIKLHLMKICLLWMLVNKIRIGNKKKSTWIVFFGCSLIFFFCL